MSYKIIALFALSFLLVSCGTNTENNVETIETETVESEETDPVIQDFINDLDSLIESSEDDS